MKTEYLTVIGMTSEECASIITYCLGSLPGVGDVKVSLAAGAATIHFNELRISVDRLKAAVEEAGYDVDHAGPVHTRRIPVTTVSP